MPFLFWKVLKAGREHRARVLIFLETLSFVNALPVFLLMRLLYRSRIVFYLGDIGGGTLVQLWLGRLADLFAEVVVVNSRAVRDGLRDNGWRRSVIHVVHNGVDLESFRDAVPVDRKSLVDWPRDAFVFGFVGQIQENKGIADFLAAARRTLEQVPEARFLVIGDCPQKSDYPARLREEFADLEDRVYWTGQVSDVQCYYKLMDAVVVSSRHVDPAPNVNLEAMASGLPVIATAIGGSPELIEDGVTGFLVVPSAPYQISEYMIRLARNNDLTRTMGKAGQERCRRMFGVKRNAEAVQSLIIGEAANTEAVLKPAN
jgi:glycosyltransferase involved in cell wall biosynthesis